MLGNYLEMVKYCMIVEPMKAFGSGSVASSRFYKKIFMTGFYQTNAE